MTARVARGRTPRFGRCSPTVRRRDGEGGFVSLTLPMLLWLATVVAIVVIDLGGYLVAASRAQTLADNAALAAVSTSVVGAAGGAPGSEARALVERGGGRLEACRCPPRGEAADVIVSVPIPGLVMPSLGAGRMQAEASAVLAPPDDLPPGPTRDRARWRWHEPG